MVDAGLYRYLWQLHSKKVTCHPPPGRPGVFRPKPEIRFSPPCLRGNSARTVEEPGYVDATNKIEYRHDIVSYCEAIDPSVRSSGVNYAANRKPDGFPITDIRPWGLTKQLRCEQDIQDELFRKISSAWCDWIDAKSGANRSKQKWVD